MKIEIRKGISIFQGTGVCVEGIFCFGCGTVKLNNILKGKIIAPNGTLIIGKMAVIDAEINVGTAIIMGRVSGLIFAEKKIEIYPPSQIFGNIQAPEILIAAGVDFHGYCNVSSQKITLKDSFMSDKTGH
ncbi:MAG: polymer-forming cytoskeletal protein [Desulfobacterales bacterium]